MGVFVCKMCETGFTNKLRHNILFFPTTSKNPFNPSFPPYYATFFVRLCPVLSASFSVLVYYHSQNFKLFKEAHFSHYNKKFFLEDFTAFEDLTVFNKINQVLSFFCSLCKKSRGNFES